MREIKFQFIYKGIPYSSENNNFNWIKKTYTLEQLCEKPLSELCDVHSVCELVAKRQYTGKKDSDGVEIYEGDIVDFTLWWFDGIECESHLRGQIVYSDELMSFQLKGVKNKIWQNHTGYGENQEYLTPFSELNFDGADFSVVGNIYENPELLEL